MRFHTISALFVVVVSTRILDSASASAVALPRKLSQTDDLISELCQKTTYVDLCIKSVTENIKGKPTGISILNAEIDAATKGVKVALAQVAKLIKSASKQEKEILDTCNDCYGSAVKDLNDAKTSIKARDSHSVNIHISAMMTEMYTCDDIYSEFSIPSPLKKLDEQLSHLSSNSLRILEAIVL